MTAQVKLQWTHVTVAGVTQEVQRKIGAGAYEPIFSGESITANLDVENGWMVIDPAYYEETTDVSYRVVVINGTYSLPSNEVVFTINATPIAVTDLAGEVEVAPPM